MARRPGRKTFIGFCLLATLTTAAADSFAFELANTVSPAITANPIEVVIWIKDGVTPENEARVLDQISQGLQMWEDVPTSEIRFQIVDIVHASTDPGKQPHQIQIIVGNQASFTSGGASLPSSSGDPGTWYGAVADVPTLRLVEVTAHEIGHTIGFLHSTISVAFPIEQRPMMHYAIASPILLQDDIAAISSAYPNPGYPNLLDVSGTVRGRLVAADTATPVTGVNVVAIDSASGAPVVARVSGADGPPGSFVLLGLPPSTYAVRFLDGYSFRGSSVGLSPSTNFQADNFTTFGSQPLVVVVGAQIDLGDIPVSLQPMSIDGVHIGPVGFLDSSIPIAPVSSRLPDAYWDEPYEIWLHVLGGLRPLTAQVTGLPAGLAGAIAGDPRSSNASIHGGHYARIAGSPQAAGDFPLNVQIGDLRGARQNVAFNLTVICRKTGDRDGDTVPDCQDTCFDADADGYGTSGPSANSCAGPDCDDANAWTHPGAPEVNDGLDNQCPGDDGHGTIDETSGDSGFHAPADTARYSWPPQQNATSYEVVRSTKPGFLDGCLFFTSSQPFILDPENPRTGSAFFYLNRPLAPHVGSWGSSSAGERTIPC